MNEQLTKRLLEYLQLDTAYAIIITGDYGIGKTHYLKSDLFPKVKKLKTQKEGEETFTPILISLFGVKSIEDIQNQILIELYPILKNKGFKIAAGVGKALYKFAAGSDFNELLSNTGTASSDIIDFTKILLCVDDIDRKSPNLNIKEFFGFINNLVENHEAKVLLVANEDKLRKEADSEEGSYSVLREKVIGVSVIYRSEVDLVFDEIIKSKYKKTFSNYYKFLDDNKRSIISLITKNNDNLRNLLFFLEHFKIIYQAADQLVVSNKKYSTISSELLAELLKFTLPIAIEYKMGRLHNENAKEIENLYGGYFFDIDAFLGNKKEKAEKSYADSFKENYLDESNTARFFFSSIFNYIMGRNSFEISNLILDVDAIYKLDDSGIPEKQSILSKLSYWQCLNLPQKDYRALTVKLLKYVDAGDFELEEYPSIFRHVVRFDNVLHYNLDNLVRRFRKGIDKGSAKHVHQRHYSMHFRINATDEFYDYIKQIVDYCIEVNASVKLLEMSNGVNEMFELFKTDFQSFLDKIQEPNTEIFYTPILSKFNLTKFLNSFHKLSNNEIIDFAFFLQHKYRNGMNPDLYPDEDFITDLFSHIDNELRTRHMAKFKRVAYEVLLTKAKEALGNFSK